MAAKGNRQRPRPIKVCDFTNVITGGTPSTRNASYWENGDVPWLPSGVCQDCYVDSAPSFITKDGLDNSAAKMMPPDTILIALTGATAGKVGHLTFSACANQSVTGILPSDHHYPRYLFHYLLNRRKKTLDDCYGGAQPHISQGYVKNIQVPLCELPAQRRIAGELDKICELKENAETRLGKLDLLVKSRFVEMFGDVTVNDRGWETATLPELGELNRGVSKARPRNSPELLGGPYPLVQTGDVSNSGLWIKNYSSTYSDKGLAQSRLWKRGTLCITIAANIAQTAILDFDACFPDSVVGFVPNERTDAIFIHYWFSFFQKILEAQAPQVAQKNINLRILSGLKVVEPPLALQREFAAFVERVDKLKDVAKKSVEQIDTLYRAKLQEYFG